MMEGQEEPSSTTRHEVLAAGAQLIAETVASQVLPGVRAVCREAGIGPATFYRHFEDATEFHTALVRRLLEHSGLAAAAEDLSAEIVDATDETAGADDRGSRVTRQVAQKVGESFSRLEDGSYPDDRLQLVLIGLSGGDDPVADAVREGYRQSYEQVLGDDTTAISAVVDSLGGVVRPPFTEASIGVIFRAVYEGLRMRSLVDKTFDAVTVLEDLTRVLLIALLAHPDRPEDIDTLLQRTVDAVSAARPA